jgi:hypothetical protein
MIKSLKLPRLPIDEYEMRAQLLPALVVSVPVVAFVYGVLPSVRGFWSAISGTVLEAAVLFVLMKIGRDRGIRLQTRLYQKWGGKPTTILLRYYDNTIDPHTKQRYKIMLSELTGLRFPTEAEELEAPEGADQVYESAVRALLERRRSKSYLLVFRENCNYGFVRNLVGLKMIGLGAVSATLLADGLLYWRGLAEVKGLILSIFVSLLSSAILFSLTRISVKGAGEGYALALLRTCEPVLKPTRAH